VVAYSLFDNNSSVRYTNSVKLLRSILKLPTAFEGSKYIWKNKKFTQYSFNYCWILCTNLCSNMSTCQ